MMITKQSIDFVTLHLSWFATWSNKYNSTFIKCSWILTQFCKHYLSMVAILERPKCLLHKTQRQLLGLALTLSPNSLPRRNVQWWHITLENVFITLHHWIFNHGVECVISELTQVTRCHYSMFWTRLVFGVSICFKIVKYVNHKRECTNSSTRSLERKLKNIL